MKNMCLALLIIVFIGLSINLNAQEGVAINSTGAAADASAILDVSSTTQGFLPPRMTEAQRNDISSPATGLLIYQTDGTSGFYYYTGTQWQVTSAVNPSYEIGDNALGGIVFYINADGTHGLVAAVQDQFTSNWYNAHDNLNNPAYHDTEGAKYFDWRLPSKYELNLMYGRRGTIGASITNYWCSTEFSSNPNFAWYQIFDHIGNQAWAPKTSSNRVRAIREF